MKCGTWILRRWTVMVCFMCACTLFAQNGRQFSLELKNKPLPAALKLIEKEGGKNIIFSYNEIESYHVTVSISQKTEVEAIRMVLKNTPFVCKERDEYFVVQKSAANRHLIEIRGKVEGEHSEPLSYANVVLLSRQDSTFVDGVVTGEDGSFLMAAEDGVGYLLKVSYLGYRTKVQSCAASNNIRLEVDSKLLGEVTVKSNRPLMERKDNGLLVNVAGSFLSKMGTAAEMISHLPFVTDKGDGYTVLGHGAPVIYINSRKARGMDLQRLSADEIVSAEVITTPGVEYGSDVSAVIRIRTIRKRGQGWSGTYIGAFSQGHAYNASENLFLNYRIGGLDIFLHGYTNHWDSYKEVIGTKSMNTSSVWELAKKTKTISHGNALFAGEFGLNYEPDEDHSFGVRYMPDTNIGDTDLKVYGETTVHKDGKQVDELLSSQYNRDLPGWTQYINGYYNGTLGSWKIDFNADYYFSRSHSFQDVMTNDEEAANSENNVRNYFYATRLVVNRKFGKHGISFGTEETFTNRHDLFTQSGFSSNANDHIKQSVYSIFANYSVKISKFNLSAGLRYERQKSDYYEGGVYQKEQSPTYNDLIPVLSVAYSKKDFDLNLSYRQMKYSPRYDMLSSAVNYQSKYEYSSGNPLLVPQMHHRFSLDANWKLIFASAYFDRILDIYTHTIKPYNDETYPGVILYTMASIPTTNYYGLSVNFSPKIGCWQLKLDGSMEFMDSDARSLGITQHWNEPQFYFGWDNSFTLPHDYFFNIRGRITTAAKQGHGVDRTEGQVSARFSKTFLKQKNLTVTLTANDILHTGYSHYIMYGDRTNVSERSYSDVQRFGVLLIYKFNATKSKYKGAGAGENEKARL